MNRTLTQNSSLHLYFTLLADELNNAGFDQMAILEKKMLPTPNTPESIKGMFRLIQAAMYPVAEGEKVSTANLDSKQIQAVYLVLDKFIAENFEISIDWPHYEGKP